MVYVSCIFRVKAFFVVILDKPKCNKHLDYICLRQFYIKKIILKKSY